MAGSAASKEGGRMKCQETVELISALCDGETIPREAAEHIGECEACRARLNVYSTVGAELRRVASLEEPKEVKAGSWEKVQRARPYSWQEWRTTMRIPRFAFALMLGMILLLSGGLVLVRARTGTGGPVLVLTYKIPPDGRPARCAITTDGNPRTNHCNYSTGGPSGLLTVNIRFVSKEGERTELGVRTKYETQARILGKEVVFNLGGSDSTDSGDQDAALMIYFPGEGRYLISTVPFEGAVEGKVELGQIKFRLEGQNYVLLTAMPTTRSEHIWVAHDPRYKLSQHMEGASDSRDMFMVRSLSRLLEEQIHH